MARENKRTVDKAVRHIEREQKKLQAQEKKALEDIKKMATKNQHVSIPQSDCYSSIMVIKDWQNTREKMEVVYVYKVTQMFNKP